MAQPLQTLTDGQHAKVLRTLDTLEDAQRLVADAAELLSAVPGFATEWEDIKNLHDKMKSCCHAVESCRAMVNRTSAASPDA